MGVTYSHPPLSPGPIEYNNTMSSLLAIIVVIVVVVSTVVVTVVDATGDLACSLNGHLVTVGVDTDRESRLPAPSTPSDTPLAQCKCEPGWTGTRCGVLDLLPSTSVNGFGFRAPNGGSSWGGSVVGPDEKTGAYHMYAALMRNNCTLKAWKTNSEIVHAVSQNPTGPYHLAAIAGGMGPHNAIVLPSFAHNPTVRAISLGSSSSSSSNLNGNRNDSGDGGGSGGGGGGGGYGSNGGYVLYSIGCNASNASRPVPMECDSSNIDAGANTETTAAEVATAAVKAHLKGGSCDGPHFTTYATAPTMAGPWRASGQQITVVVVPPPPPPPPPPPSFDDHHAADRVGSMITAGNNNPNPPLPKKTCTWTTNPAPILHSNGSALWIYRQSGGCWTSAPSNTSSERIGVGTSGDFRGAPIKDGSVDRPLFDFPLEDVYAWRDASGDYHALTHKAAPPSTGGVMPPPSPITTSNARSTTIGNNCTITKNRTTTTQPHCGTGSTRNSSGDGSQELRSPHISGHLFSRDGLHWNIGIDSPYNDTIALANGDSITFEKRARPQVLVREGRVFLLTTGAVLSNGTSITTAQLVSGWAESF